MPREPKSTVLEYVCKEVIVHGVTGKKRICGKVIRSLYPTQFDWYRLEHQAKHRAEKDGMTVEQAMLKIKSESTG